MLTRFLYVFLLFLGLPLLGLGQFENGACGTGPAPEHVRAFNRSVDYNQPQPEEYSTINIPVTIHIVRTSNGGGGFFENNAFLTICDLNNRMSSSGMFFYLNGPVRFIDSDVYYNTTDFGDLFNMIDLENVPRTMNVYYTNLGQLGLCGFAFYPNTGPGGFQNDGAVVMSFACSQPNGTTLTHEVGHFFNLPHTFDQTSSNPLSATNAERVTRLTNEVAPRLSANCATAGDDFCDTPADFIGNRWSCPTGQVQFDINGDRFRPDSSFYMSYSNDACMSRFSTQQILAMRATLANTAAPRGYLLTSPMPNFGSITQAPAQLSPQTSDTIPGNQAVFSWNRVPGATFYQVRILLFNFAVIDTITSDTFYVSNTRAIRQQREHSWEIRALNGANLCTQYSGRVSFFAGNYIQTTSVENPLGAVKRIYPNPVARGGSIQLDGYQGEEKLEAMLYDLTGRKVASLDAKEDASLLVPYHVRPGIYLLQVQSKTHQQSLRLLVE